MKLWIVIFRRSSAHQRKQHLRRPFAKLLIAPFLSLDGKWNEKLERFANTASVSCPVVPQINSYVFSQSRQQHQTIEIPHAVTPGPCACQLQRLAAVGLNLQRNPLLSRSLQSV